MTEAPQAQPALPVAVGEILAEKYSVERVLGRGGMGVVVAARHLQLGEHVAIKLLLPEFSAVPDFVNRFLQEARAAVRIRNEHVARVLDVGTLPNSAPYLVMEYLEGQDLQKVINDRTQLPSDEAVDLILQACEAIAEAHLLGIIHRDLKPSNLFVARRANGTACVKVIDFGVSKTLRQLESVSGAVPVDVTSSRIMLGSPLYMSPEQMQSSRDVDTRCDLWSLACILHSLLTGVPPFLGTTVMDIFEKILAGPPPLAKLCPDIPDALDAVVRRALSKKIERRYADVQQLAVALRPFASPLGQRSVEHILSLSAHRNGKEPAFDGERVSPFGAVAEERRAWLTRRRVIGASAAFVLAAGLGLLAWSLGSDHSSSPRAEESWEPAPATEVASTSPDAGRASIDPVPPNPPPGSLEALSEESGPRRSEPLGIGAAEPGRVVRPSPAAPSGRPLVSRAKPKSNLFTEPL